MAHENLIQHVTIFLCSYNAIQSNSTALLCKYLPTLCQEGTIILHLSLPALEDYARDKQTMLCPFSKTIYLQPFILETWVLERADYLSAVFQVLHFFLFQFLVRYHPSPFPFTPSINRVDRCFYGANNS